MRRIVQHEGPVVARFTCGAVRRSVCYKQREENSQKSGHALTREEGLPVEGFAPHNEVYCQLGGRGTAGRHGQEAGSVGLGSFDF